MRDVFDSQHVVANLHQTSLHANVFASMSACVEVLALMLGLCLSTMFSLLYHELQH